MASNFPATIDVFTNPGENDYLDAEAVPHSDQHANANDAIEALQAKVGIDNSEDPTSIDYILAHKVDQEAGKGLSSNDYTDTEKAKLGGIEVGANAYTHPTQHAPSIIAQDASNRFVTDDEKSTWNGKADLVGGKVPAAQLPGYVDDVLEFATVADFPAVGESGKIYIAADSNLTFRWSGSGYAGFSAAPGSTDAVTEGSTNLYFTVARVRAVVLTGLSLVTNAAISATDTVLSALGKLQKQITDLALANTGDETAATIKSKLGITTLSGSNTGDQTLGSLGAQSTANRDASNGYAGLTSFKLNMKNVAGTIVSFFTNTNTAARTYTLPDKDGTVAMLSDITGTNSGVNTGDETAETIRSKLPAKSIVILSSGQSNMPDDQAYSWSPAPNLYLWNFSAKTQLSSEVGTAFVPVSSSLVGPSVAAANVLAMENPQAKVYVINIFLGGMWMKNWGPSPDAPPTGYNFRQAISGNVPIALAAIGRSDIDYFVWGGGESDANSQSQTFSSDFETWIATWLKTQSWFAPYTPIYLLSMSPYVATSSGNGDFLWRRYNNSLRAIAAADPSCRSYIDTDDFPISLFDPSAPMPYLHRTPEGHFRIGEKLGRSIISGVSEPIARMDNKEGTYTPIFSDLVNVTTITLGFADWVRTGNLIDVTMRIAVVATTAGLDTSFKVSIPVLAHAFPSHVSGLFQSYYGDVGIVAVVLSSQNVSVNYVAKYAVPSASCITFRYRVKDSDALPNPP